MRKKHEKKNKSRKQEQVKNQQKRLLKETDVAQIEKNQDMLTDDVDKEQRRNTRLGAIIAIVAIIGTACAFLFKMTINTLNVWSEQGLIYWYLQVLFLSALSISVIIFIDIVMYVISDLKRHNITNENYKQFDQISDNKYEYLLTEFKIYILMLFGVYSLSIPLATIYAEREQRWSGMIASVFCLIFGIVFLVIWIKGKSKEDIKKVLITIIKKSGKLLIIGLMCFILGLAFITNTKATVKVKCNSNGIVEISNTSAESYSGLDIVICNMKDEKILEKSVERKEVLFAKEDKYVSNEVAGEKVAEGILLKDEWLHWKYIFDLNEKMEEPGKYYISVTVHQKGKSVLLLNSFLLKGKEYTFAQDNMEKEY